MTRSRLRPGTQSAMLPKVRLMSSTFDWLRTFALGYVEGLGSACKPVDGHGRWESSFGQIYISFSWGEAVHRPNSRPY